MVHTSNNNLLCYGKNMQYFFVLYYRIVEERHCFGQSTNVFRGFRRCRRFYNEVHRQNAAVRQRNIFLFMFHE